MIWNPFTAAMTWFARNGFYRMAAVLGYGSTSDSGITVDLQSMMTLSTVWACSKVLSESFGSLPCHLYEETKSGKQRKTDSPLYRVLHDRWNPYMTATQGRECMMLWASNAGNAIARIEWSGNEVRALWPIEPARVEFELGPRAIRYFELQPNGKRDPIPVKEVFHIPNISSNGYLGMGIVDYAKNTIGNGLSATRYAGKFFANGGKVPGIIKVPNTFKTDEQAKEFREKFEATYGGPDNAHKNMLLGGDVDFKPLGISLKDAQFIEWSAFSVPDVCRFYRVPPHMVADLSRATFSNIEHQGLEFVNYTLMPWIIRWEQQIQMRLIDFDVAGNIGKARQFAKFNVDALMRGDFASRWQGYATALQNGVLSIDDVLELEDLNKLQNGSGSARHIQLNMQTVPGTGTPTASELATLAKISAAPTAAEGQTNGKQAV